MTDALYPSAAIAQVLDEMETWAKSYPSIPAVEPFIKRLRVLLASAPSATKEPTFKPVWTLFHRILGDAADRKGYDKEAWKSLQFEIHKMEALRASSSSAPLLEKPNGKT